MNEKVVMNDKIVMPLWTMCLFIVVMNTTMFNVSLPTIIQDLQISADLGSWVISSYRYQNDNDSTDPYIHKWKRVTVRSWFSLSISRPIIPSFGFRRMV